VRNLAKGGNVFFPNQEARKGLEREPDHRAALTERGVQEAHELGTRLRVEFGTFDAIFHSGYRRTHETAEAVADALNQPRPLLREASLLRERDPGYTFNMTAEEASAAYPWLQDYWATVGPLFSRPPGGESLADVAVRVQLFLERTRHELADQRVLLVTHVGTIRMLRFVLEGWTHEQLVGRWADSGVANGSFIAFGRKEEASVTDAASDVGRSSY
jgi:2,3-bisphosphoglycerate-dependent phosphoglycerate mutase